MPGQGLDCNVDIVMCIDATGSMGSTIERVKENALKFHDRIRDALAEKDRIVKDIRVKVIVFRDLYVDGNEALVISDFFRLPDENAAYQRFVNRIEAKGGGDEPESALEALALAMKSDWVRSGAKRRHIIMVFTDASAHPLEKAADTRSDNYPTGIPSTVLELNDWWMDPQGGPMNPQAKRLIIFAPNAEPWATISSEWENVVYVPAVSGEGMAEIDMKSVLLTIAGSI